MKRDRYIPRALRRKVLERDNQRCRKCGHGPDYLELHHMKPWCEGGEHSEENLITLCSACHNEWTHVADGLEDFEAWLRFPVTVYRFFKMATALPPETPVGELLAAIARRAG